MRHEQNLKKRYRLLLFLALTLPAVGIGGLAGCKRGGEETSATKAAPAAEKGAGTQVSVTPARVASLSDAADVTGALNAQNDVVVGVKLAGKVVAVYAREGDPVKQNQVVAQQDIADYQAQLDQQRANLAAAKAKWDQANVVYKNAVTTLKWTDDQTKSAVKQAQAALDAAREQADIVKQGARPQERQQAEENVVAAKADRTKARSDLKRYQELFREQAVSAQQLDQAQATADSADARYNAAVQALSLIQEGSRREDIRRAQAAVEQANQTLIAAQSNRDQVNLRRADVTNAVAGIASAKAGVRQAEAALRLAEQALRDTTVRSPLDGVVAERKVEPGAQLGAGKDVMRIVDLRSIYFDAQLSETQYSEVRIGQPVKVTVDALPGRVFQGSIGKIFPIASATARSFTVRIHIQNEGNTLRPQMFTRGQIMLATHPHAIVVPRDAVLDFDGKTGSVFVITDKQTAQKRKVTIGFSDRRVFEIASGVAEGDSVVTTGQSQLQDGDKVQVHTNGNGAVQTSKR